MRFPAFRVAILGTLLPHIDAVSIAKFPGNDYQTPLVLELTQVTADSDALAQWDYQEVDQTALVPYEHTLLTQSYLQSNNGLESQAHAEFLSGLISYLSKGAKELLTQEAITSYIMWASSYVIDNLGYFADWAMKQVATYFDYVSFVNIIEAMQDLQEKVEPLVAILKDPYNISAQQVIDFFAQVPVIGGFFSTIKDIQGTLGEIADRLKSGKDDTACYRPVALRSSFKVSDKQPCPKPSILENETCYQPCPADKEGWGNICLRKCPVVEGVEWTRCGMLCMKDQAHCGQKAYNAVLDVFNAGTIWAFTSTKSLEKAAGGLTLGIATNFVYLLDIALRGLSVFSYPDCISTSKTSTGQTKVTPTKIPKAGALKQTTDQIGKDQTLAPKIQQLNEEQYEPEPEDD